MSVEGSSETLVIDKDKETASSGAASPQAPVSDVAAPAAAVTSPRRKAGRLQRFVRVGAGVWVGLVIAAAGFGVIAYTWGEVAALLNVALQLPYVVSGGLTGLGLILLGLLVTNIAVKRREALERSRQLDEIREALVRLRLAVEGTEES
jgi:hypothetical protein